MARLSYYSGFKLDPDNMTEEDFIKNVERLKFCLMERGELTVK